MNRQTPAARGVDRRRHHRNIALALLAAGTAAVFFLTGEPAPEGRTAPLEPAGDAGPAAEASRAVQPAPRAAAAPDAGSPRPAGAGAPGDLALAGHLITLGQKLALGEALAKNAVQADALVDRLCEESRALRPAMADPPAAESDAAGFMSDRVDYEKPLDQPPGLLHLPDELRRRLSKTPDWLGAVTDADLAGRDFSWLPALAQFDHWSYLKAGRLREHPENDALTGSIPNYSSLLGWAKLRYALALRRSDGAAASREVRHLADLIRTQHVLIAELSAIALYRFDLQARTAFAAAAADVTGWVAADPAALDAQRRLAFGSLYFLYPGVAAETARKAAGCMVSPCAAIAEATAFNRSFGAAAGTDNLALLRELSSSNGCETALIDRLGSARELPTGEALAALGIDLPQQLPRYFPPR